MTTDTSKAVVERCAAEVWNRGNFAAAPAHIAVDFVCHGGGAVADVDVRSRKGRDRWIGGNRKRVPDFQAAFNDLSAEGVRVVGRRTVRGTIAVTTAVTVNSLAVPLMRVQRCQTVQGMFPDLIAVDFSESCDSASATAKQWSTAASCCSGTSNREIHRARAGGLCLHRLQTSSA